MKREQIITALLSGFYAVCFGSMMVCAYNLGVTNAESKQLQKEKDRLESERRMLSNISNFGTRIK